MLNYGVLVTSDISLFSPGWYFPLFLAAVLAMMALLLFLLLFKSLILFSSFDIVESYNRTIAENSSSDIKESWIEEEILYGVF